MEKREFFKNILFSIITVVIFFSSLEVIQRIRYPTIGYRYMYNSLGFRSPEFSIEKTPGSIRILFIGSSTTFGIDNNLENTFPYLVEKLLREKVPDKYIEIINTAQPARNSFWIVERIKDTLYLKPDILIVMSIYNDIVLMTTPKSYYELVDGKLIFKNPWYRKIHNFLKTHSIFYITLREKIALILYGSPIYAYTPFREKIESLSEMDSRLIKACLDNYKTNLNKIVQIAHDYDIRLIFLRPPLSELRKRAYPCYYKGYQVLIKGLEEVAYGNNIPLIDISDSLSVLKYRDTFTDGIHFTDKANREIALGISNYLLNHKENYLGPINESK